MLLFALPANKIFCNTGPLTNLKQSMVQLQRPRRLFDAGSFGMGGALSTRFRPVERAGSYYTRVAFGFVHQFLYPPPPSGA